MTVQKWSTRFTLEKLNQPINHICLFIATINVYTCTYSLFKQTVPARSSWCSKIQISISQKTFSFESSQEQRPRRLKKKYIDQIIQDLASSPPYYSKRDRHVLLQSCSMCPTSVFICCLASTLLPHPRRPSLHTPILKPCFAPWHFAPWHFAPSHLVPHVSLLKSLRMSLPHFSVPSSWFKILLYVWKPLTIYNPFPVYSRDFEHGPWTHPHSCHLNYHLYFLWFLLSSQPFSYSHFLPNGRTRSEPCKLPYRRPVTLN